MAKDYYLYMPCDRMMLGYNMTLEEAQQLKNDLDTEYPDEAGLSIICKASDDYKLAAERAFVHMSNW